MARRPAYGVVGAHGHLTILDLVATDDVWIVSTATADLRVPRR